MIVSCSINKHIWGSDIVSTIKDIGSNMQKWIKINNIQIIYIIQLQQNPCNQKYGKNVMYVNYAKHKTKINKVYNM